jgi:hypothetical protein
LLYWRKQKELLKNGKSDSSAFRGPKAGKSSILRTPIFQRQTRKKCANYASKYGKRKRRKDFIKSSLRVQKNKEEAPTLPLPPQPIVTCWGTRLDTAICNCTNYSEIEKILITFDTKDSSPIKSVQQLLSVTMSRNLTYIKANSRGISQSITRLETADIQLCDAINIVQKTESELSRVQGEVANKVKANLECAWTKFWIFNPV